MPDTVSLVLTINDVNAILNVLGELPSKTGAWPLIVNIREQADAQVKAAAAAPVPETERSLALEK